MGGPVGYRTDDQNRRSALLSAVAQAEPPVLLSIPGRLGGARRDSSRAAWSAPWSEGSPVRTCYLRNLGPSSTGGKTNGYTSHLRECRAVSHRSAGDLSAWVDSLTGSHWAARIAGMVQRHDDPRGEPNWQPVTAVTMMAGMLTGQLAASRGQLELLEQAAGAPGCWTTPPWTASRVFGVQHDDMWL